MVIDYIPPLHLSPLTLVYILPWMIRIPSHEYENYFITLPRYYSQEAI